MYKKSNHNFLFIRRYKNAVSQLYHDLRNSDRPNYLKDCIFKLFFTDYNGLLFFVF